MYNSVADKRSGWSILIRGALAELFQRWCSNQLRPAADKFLMACAMEDVGKVNFNGDAIAVVL